VKGCANTGKVGGGVHVPRKLRKKMKRPQNRARAHMMEVGLEMPRLRRLCKRVIEGSNEGPTVEMRSKRG
jgi:hypothetical protein